MAPKKRESSLKKRKTGVKHPKGPILIVCEDSKSSVFYLKDKIRNLRIIPLVDVDGDSDPAPISVVNYAIERRKQQKREARERGIEEYRTVYCVMDVDEHPTIRQAIVKARDNGLVAIISNQCFELWYLLHFIDYSTAFLHRDEICRRLEKFIGKEYEKGDKAMYEILKRLGNEAKAIGLARRLKTAAQEESEEKDPLRNPSTDVFELIEKLNSF
jgi:hypothetical protein